jgi:uncharacterized protein with PIN domain
MTARLEAGFRRRFRDLLALVRPRLLEKGVELLMRRASTRSQREGVPLVRALADLYEFTRVRVARRLEVTGACDIVEPPWKRFARAPPRFLCDGSLGGLARWLRAAGYPAAAESRSGESLAAEAAVAGVVLLTSEVAVLDRRAVREGRLAVVWVPSGLEPAAQLGLVLRDLGLAPRPSLCMACGGSLVPVLKGEVAPRIPPRTARWKDEYFVCSICDRLFWEGTHWQRISRVVALAAAS